MRNGGTRESRNGREGPLISYSPAGTRISLPEGTLISALRKRSPAPEVIVHARVQATEPGTSGADGEPGDPDPHFFVSAAFPTLPEVCPIEKKREASL